jgi:hypothetical protein
MPFIFLKANPVYKNTVDLLVFLDEMNTLFLNLYDS